MPNLLAWMEDPKTGEFGAMVQLNSRIFAPQLAGSVQVRNNPQTRFFDKAGIAQMAEVAGEKSRPFWERTLSDLPRYEAFYQNRMGIEAGSVKPQPETGLAQGTRVPGFNMS